MRRDRYQSLRLERQPYLKQRGSYNVPLRHRKTKPKPCAIYRGFFKGSFSIGESGVGKAFNPISPNSFLFQPNNTHTRRVASKERPNNRERVHYLVANEPVSTLHTLTRGR